MPTVSNEEWENMEFEKRIYWTGLIEAIAEKEENEMNKGKGKVKNRGHQY